MATDLDPAPLCEFAPTFVEAARAVKPNLTLIEVDVANRKRSELRCSRRGLTQRPRRARRHCCVSSSHGAGRRSLRQAWSDCLGEFVERGRDSEVVVSGVGAEFVMAAPDILDERVAAYDD